MNRLTTQKVFAPRATRYALLIVISLLLIALVGCGKKGPVRPKQQSLPAAPGTVSLQQQGNSFLLAWDIPTKNQDGRPALELAGFRVNRLDYDAETGCPTCRDPEDLFADIDKDYPAPAERIGSRIYLRDSTITAGKGYRYAIIPLTIGGSTGETALVHLSGQQPSRAPISLKAESGPKRAALEWATEALPEGAKLIGFNVYRRINERPYSVVPVNSSPLTEPRLLDRGLENNQTYEYRVSSLIEIGDNRIESLPSEPVQVVPGQ